MNIIEYEIPMVACIPFERINKITKANNLITSLTNNEKVR